MTTRERERRTLLAHSEHELLALCEMRTVGTLGSVAILSREASVVEQCGREGGLISALAGAGGFGGEIKGLARVLCGLRATCESVLVRSWASQAPGVVRVGRKWTATREGPLRPTRPSGAIDQAIPSLVRLALSRSTHARKKEEGKTSSMCDCRAKLETWREPRKEGGTDGEGETQDGATQERRDERERENLHERGNKTESETRRERERTSFWGGSRLGAGTRRRGGHERDETPRATVYFLPALSQSLTCCMRARCVSTRRTQTASKRSGEGRTMSANETMQTCRHGAESTVSNAPSSKTSLDVEGTRAAPSARCRAQCAASRRGTGP